MYGLAGFRVGYAVAAPDVIASMQKPRSPFNVNILAQTAAIAASNDDTFVEASKTVNADGMAQLTLGAESLGMSVVPSHANFILIDTKRPCRDVYDLLLRDGVIVRTGDIFGLPTMLRVTIGTQAQNEKFLDALTSAAAKVQPVYTSIGRCLFKYKRAEIVNPEATIATGKIQLAKLCCSK